MSPLQPAVMQDGVGPGLGRIANELMGDWRVSRLPQVYHNSVCVPSAWISCVSSNGVRLSVCFEHVHVFLGKFL